MVKRSIDHKPSCQDLGESSDSAFQEEIETSKGMCQHVGKSVSLADIKRQLKSNRRIGTCDKKVPTPCSAPGEGDETSSTPAAGALLPHGIWLCMQCGHQGCARHATQHFNTPRSDSHALAADTADWAVWCFTCNEKVSLKSNKKLHEAVQFVKKKQGTLRPGATPSKEDSPQPSKSSKNVSAKEKQTQAEREHESLPKVKGLINLGNSCYLNSVLQCLSQCHYLTHYLDISSRSGRKVTVSADGETLDLVLPEGGPITASLCDFLKQMHITGTASTVSPSHLLRKIALKVPQFVGCDQQDAHELLRALMEQARLEDLRRHQRQIMLGLGLPTKADPKEMPDELKARAKALGKQVSHTTIDTIFSGQLVSLVVCQACMARTHRMEPFLDLSLPVAEDKPTRPKKLSCGAGAEEEDGEYVLSPGKNSGRPSKHALKKERKAARRTKKHGPAAAEPDGASKDDPAAADTEKRPTSDSSGQELDRRSDAASAEGESDADEEDNGDTDLMIDSLLPDDPPSGRVSPDPDAPQPAAESEEFLERLRALAVGRGDGDDPRAAAGGEECPPQTAPGRPTSPAEPTTAPAGRVPLVGGDARRCAPVDRADPGGAGDAADGTRATSDVRPTDSAAAAAAAEKKTPSGATLPVSETPGVKQNCATADVCMEESPRGAEECADAPSATCAGAEAALPNGPLPTDCQQQQQNESAETKPTAADSPAAVDMECEPPQNSGTTVAAPPDTPAFGGDPAPPSEKGANGDSPPAPPPAEDAANGDPPPLRRCEWLSRALTTLAPRYQAASGECSILTCLNQYTAPELLAGNNKFGCDNCTELRNQRLTADEAASEKKPGTVYSNASKQLLIYSPPPVLTIHLKRFEVCNFSLRKVNRHVQFGERLDLAPFCSSISEDLPQMRPGQRRVVYSLFGVVEHSGRLTSGHYTAYVRVRRRHDLLTVNPARLTTLVTDAFGVACERARQRAEQTQPPPTSEASEVPASEATAAAPAADTTITVDAGAGAEAETLNATGSQESQKPEPEPQEPQKTDSQPELQSQPELKPEPKTESPLPQPEPVPEPQPETKSEPQEPQEEPDPEPEPGRWFYVSDTHVTEVTLDKVLKAQAYLLFYERIV